MKRTVAAVLCLAASLMQGAAQGVLLNPGATYSYEFTNFVFQTGDSFGPYAEVGLTIESLAPTDSFEFTAYENDLLQSPILTTNFVASSGLPVFPVGSAWQDFQGVFQVRMLTGSMRLLDFYGTLITADGFYYSEKPPSVPEPAIALTLGSGLLVLALVRGKRSDSRKPLAGGHRPQAN